MASQLVSKFCSQFMNVWLVNANHSLSLSLGISIVKSYLGNNCEELDQYDKKNMLSIVDDISVSIHEFSS